MKIYVRFARRPRTWRDFAPGTDRPALQHPRQVKLPDRLTTHCKNAGQVQVSLPDRPI